MKTFVLILQSEVCSPLLVRYNAIEMTAVIVITFTIRLKYAHMRRCQ